MNLLRNLSLSSSRKLWRHSSIPVNSKAYNVLDQAGVCLKLMQTYNIRYILTDIVHIVTGRKEFHCPHFLSDSLAIFPAIYLDPFFYVEVYFNFSLPMIQKAKCKSNTISNLTGRNYIQ